MKPSAWTDRKSTAPARGAALAAETARVVRPSPLAFSAPQRRCAHPPPPFQEALAAKLELEKDRVKALAESAGFGVNGVPAHSRRHWAAAAPPALEKSATALRGTRDLLGLRKAAAAAPAPEDRGAPPFRAPPLAPLPAALAALSLPSPAAPLTGAASPPRKRSGPLLSTLRAAASSSSSPSPQQRQQQPRASPGTARDAARGAEALLAGGLAGSALLGGGSGGAAAGAAGSALAAVAVRRGGAGSASSVPTAPLTAANSSSNGGGASPPVSPARAAAARSAAAAAIAALSPAFAPPGPASAWGVSDVCQWLEACGLGTYAPQFSKHAVEGGALLELCASDLDYLGITALGHRKAILRGVTALRAAEGAGGGGRGG